MKMEELQKVEIQVIPRGNPSRLTMTELTIDGLKIRELLSYEISDHVDGLQEIKIQFRARVTITEKEG